MSASTMEIPFIDSSPPSWASGYGQDEYGYFAEFSVPTGLEYWQFVTQRMRWIPPGHFLMGSPVSEIGRNIDEVQHQVTLTSGYWLADTTCTQELWEAVARDNHKSYFRHARNPVETVSFTDVAAFFLYRLSKLVPDLNPHLPTEAQWEYACRAGTLTPFSFGETIITNHVNFDGNLPYRDSPKGEFRKRTIEADAMPANPWGLYQMHGNVWEMCSDWYAPYLPEAQIDPVGPKRRSARVIRGGGFYSSARNVRSASRGWGGPGTLDNTVAWDDGADRSNSLGFRILSSAIRVDS